MVSNGKHVIESYAHVINVDRSILKLNPKLEEFGYRFECVTASELERDFSDMFSIPKSNKRLLTIIIGEKQHGISHELHNAIVHHPVFGFRFMLLQYPEVILLRRLETFIIEDDDFKDFMKEDENLRSFHSFTTDLLLQLRLYKFGEIRVAQYFHMTSATREISARKNELHSGSRGDYTLNDEEAKELSTMLKAKYKTNVLTDLAVKNFSVAYDIPEGRIRFITLMTCLESLFNLGKDQIAHTIARHLSVILSNDKEQFKENYAKIKKLYNKRNSIVHGSEYKGDLIEDYLDLLDKVRIAIVYCNKEGLTKEALFDELNAKGF